MLELYKFSKPPSAAWREADYIALVPDFFSLVFSPRWGATGSWSVSCPGHHFAAFAAASYVRETNTDQWGIIDRVTYDDHVLKVSGRMLDGILDGVTLSRDVQDKRVNNLTRMEVYYQIIFNPTTQGVPRVDGRAGDRLSELREQIAADTGTSTPPYDLTVTWTADLKPYVDWRTPTDRSEGQTAVPPVLLSTSSGQLTAAAYKRDCIEEVTAVTITATTETWGRMSRRKSLTDQTHIHREVIEDYPHTLDESQGEQAVGLRLTNYAERRLAELSAARETISGEVIALPAEVAPGDIVTVAVSEIGARLDVRVSQIDTVWEGGGVRRVPYFGGADFDLAKYMTEAAAKAARREAWKTKNGG